MATVSDGVTRRRSLEDMSNSAPMEGIGDSLNSAPMAAIRDLSNSALMAEESDRVTRSRSFGDLSNFDPMAGIGDFSNSALMAEVGYTATHRKSFGDLSNSALVAEGVRRSLWDLWYSSITANMHSIYKVHKHLRDVNEKAYEPEIIAIGPYHHGKANLEMMENHKSLYLRLLLGRNGQTLPMYTSAIKKLEKDARRCYAEPIRLSSDEFTEMLVRDGCFIIELLRKFYGSEEREENDPIFRMEWMMNSLQRDLLLFENQIPFFVLLELFDLAVEQRPTLKLNHFVLKFWENLYPGVEHNFAKKMSEGKIKIREGKMQDHHLLDLVHRYYCPPNLEKKEIEEKKKDYHLLDLANRYICLARPADHVGCCNWSDTGDATKKEEILIIHSATELTNANVQFKKKKDGTGTLFDVEFEEGVMRMPPLTVEDWTECFFRNFIAYEHYFPDNPHNYVGDYAMLLNYLIDSPADVGILSQARIINNLLGDDKAAAKFVNRLTETVSGPRRYFMYPAISGDPKRHYRYAEIFKRLDTHYKRPWNRAWAALRRDYFNSPWAYATFFAALAILVLTVVQTVCLMLQVQFKFFIGHYAGQNVL